MWEKVADRQKIEQDIWPGFRKDLPTLVEQIRTSWCQGENPWSDSKYSQCTV
jgi:hypothetical protein